MAAPSPSSRRAYWLKTLHQWHWISSALSLLGLLLFTVTGFTLNHATQIEARPQVSTRHAELPPSLKARIASPAGHAGDAGDAEAPPAPLPAELSAWLASELRLEVAGKPAEWTPEEIYLSLPRPGGDAWLRIDRAAGSLEYELTDRGWISYLNDLHKGRNTGAAWSWFIDLFAFACLVFSITGLFILKMHAGNRPTTWPVVALGLVAPVLIAILFIH